MYSNSLMEITDILNNDPTFSDVVNSAYSKNKPTIIAPRQVYGYLIISLVKYINKPTIVVTSNPEESRNLIEDLNFWSTRTIHMNFNERNEILGFPFKGKVFFCLILNVSNASSLTALPASLSIFAKSFK